jgi:hypothetical protein
VPLAVVVALEGTVVPLAVVVALEGTVVPLAVVEPAAVVAVGHPAADVVDDAKPGCDNPVVRSGAAPCFHVQQGSPSSCPLVLHPEQTVRCARATPYDNTNDSTKGGATPRRTFGLTCHRHQNPPRKEPPSKSTRPLRTLGLRNREKAEMKARNTGCRKAPGALQSAPKAFLAPPPDADVCPKPIGKVPIAARTVHAATGRVIRSIPGAPGTFAPFGRFACENHASSN